MRRRATYNLSQEGIPDPRLGVTRFSPEQPGNKVASCCWETPTPSKEVNEGVKSFSPASRKTQESAP